MRELLARILATLTALAVVGLAAGFSLLQNIPGREEAQRPAAPAAEAERFAAGRAAFDRNGCGGCHSIGGHGNPRSPLDGVGGRLDRDSIRDWIIAADRISKRLTSGVVRMKQSYAALPDQDLRALVDLLESSSAQSDVSKR